MILLGLILLAGCAQVQSTLPPVPTPAAEVRADFEKYFQALKVNGAFVVYDQNHNHFIRYNPDRCAQRFLPASTFKVLNAMIGLESGVIPDADYVIKWDGTPSPIAAWNQDHTLRSAVKNSVVWYFQELARRVGREKMQHYVDAVGYGNRNISGPIDSFWLDGGLRISPDEQIDFLRRLYNNQLPFSPRTLQIDKDIIVLEKTATYTLSAKTGWADRVTPQIGWFVGYVETNGNVYFFVTNFESSAPDSNFGITGKQITRSILQDLAVLK